MQKSSPGGELFLLLGLDRNKCIPDGTDGIQRTKAKDDAICTSFPETHKTENPRLKSGRKYSIMDTAGKVR